MANTEPIRILIVDDHKMFREGIKSILDKEKSITVSGEAKNGVEALEKIVALPVEVILMDIDMPEMNGIITSKKILDIHPEIKILALSMHFDHNYILSMLEAGAKGYILKNTGKDELIAAIKTLAGGDSYFSSEVSQILIEQISKRKNSAKHNTPGEITLTKREIEVLQLIAQEYSNQEIAEKLFISTRTVDTHRRNLLEKLQVKNTAGLVKYAMNNNLL